jgi:hypothetical protein
LIEAAYLAQRGGRPATANRFLDDAWPHMLAALRGSSRDWLTWRDCRAFSRSAADVLFEREDAAKIQQLADRIATAGAYPGRDEYEAACFLGRCAQVAERSTQVPRDVAGRLAEDFADRGLGYLRQAVERGFDQVTLLLDDPELAVVRQHVEFPKLLEALRSKYPDVVEVLPTPRETAR